MSHRVFNGVGIGSRTEGAVADGVALARFAAEHGIALTRFAYLLCGDRGRAEDLVQDAYLAMYRRFGEILPLGAPVPYVHKTIVNLHVDRMRRRASTEMPTDTIPDSVTPTAAAPDPTGSDPLWDRVAALPRRQRVAVVCRYYLDLPDTEIAHVLGCRPASVRSLVSRALTALRERAEPRSSP